MLPTDVVILAGARTPMSRYTGAFKDVSAIELGAHASREALRRAGTDPAEIEHVIFGNVMQTNSDSIYRARHEGVKAGVKTDTYGGLSRAETAENLAAEFGITRQAADEYALRSQQAAEAAYKACRMKEEIVPVEVKEGRKTKGGAEDDHC